MKVKNYLSIVGFLLVALTATIWSQGSVIPKTDPALWNDTVRVALIWNEGTASDEMPAGWFMEDGEIGKITKDYVIGSLTHLKRPIVVYSGSSPKWATLDLNSLKSDFGGKLPHVIIYVNAGYIWNQHGTIYNEPYALLKDAANSGVGIVAVGDDAAYDGFQIFPLTGPGGTGEPVQYDELYPDMASATGQYASVSQLYIELDETSDKNLEDGGLLWSVKSSKLNFKPWRVDGRGQADADIWYVDESQLTNYAYVGYQQARMSEQMWYDGTASNYVGNTPTNTIKTAANTYVEGGAYEFVALAGLQKMQNRIVMVGYQPQYLEDDDASSQIIYNAVFWASKAHQKLKIATPEPDPITGNTQNVSTVTLTVAYPTDTTLYTVYYTLDGTEPSATNGILYTGGDIDLPNNSSGDIVLKTAAISKDHSEWYDSDIGTFIYEYLGGPIIDSVVWYQGKITNPVTSEKDPDTLVVHFNAAVKAIFNGTPFEFKDSLGNTYTLTLDDILYVDSVVTFLVTGITGKPDNYFPRSFTDSLQCDPAAEITGTNGLVQNGTNNFFTAINTIEQEYLFSIDQIWQNNIGKIANKVFENPINESFNLNIDNGSGAVWLIDPQAIISDESADKIKCSFTIFDPVGNIVAQTNKLDEDNDIVQVSLVKMNGRIQIAVVWSGRNMAYRKVGIGSYFAESRYIDHKNIKHVDKSYIIVSD